MLTTPMTRIATRAAAMAAMALACHSAGATPVSWDAAADFSHQVKSNVNGVWSYGTTLNLNAAFQLMTRSGTNGSYQYWDGGDYKPSLGKAVGTAVNAAWKVPTDTLNMHPGANGEYSVLRFLAQNDGQYTVDFDFWANHSTTTDIHVLADGVEKFSGFVTSTKTYAAPGNWTSTLTLSAGDFIDFMVGKGGPTSTWNNDSTGVAALISYAAPVVTTPSNVPEPSGLLLMASGLGLAAVVRRRQRN